MKRLHLVMTNLIALMLIAIALTVSLSEATAAGIPNIFASAKAIDKVMRPSPESLVPFLPFPVRLTPPE